MGKMRTVVDILGEAYEPDVAVGRILAVCFYLVSVCTK